MSMPGADLGLTLVNPRELPLPHPISETRSEPVRILMRIFETLERADIGYCALHGYEEFSGQIKSDVDCIIDSGTSAHALLTLFRRNRDSIGAEVVRCQGLYFVFASQQTDEPPCFLALDFAPDCDVKGLPLYDGGEILATRRRYGQFFIPALDLEFGAYLARCIAKQSLGEDRARHLSNLYRRDPEGCAAQVARHWKDTSAESLIAAARSGNWESVQKRLSNIQAELRRNAIRRYPTRFLAIKLRCLVGTITRLLWPDGVSVAFLGPDGAGKSSVIEAVDRKLADVFPRSTCWGFAPALLAFFRRGKRSTNEPHGLPARSLLASLGRVAYWFAYYTFSFVTLRLALARSTLVLYDRHFVDILVDQRRYRYGGPLWLLRLLWRIIPKPDLIILLDSPPEVLQARKQEVPFELTAQQRQAYLALVQTLANGHIVDASQPLSRVTNSAARAILRYTAERAGADTSSSI